MKQEVPPLVKVDLTFDKNKSIPLLADCIPGAVPWQHTLLKGSELTLEPGPLHHILQTVVGDAQFETDGNEYIFHERVCFIPHPDKPVTVKALTDLQILEVRWSKRLPEDDNLMAEYKTQYPVIQIYRNSKQYRDRNKSERPSPVPPSTSAGSPALPWAPWKPTTSTPSRAMTTPCWISSSSPSRRTR